MIFGPDDLRAIADLDGRAGEPCGKALRWAADEIDRLQQRITELSVEGTWVAAPVLRLVQPSDTA